MLDDAAPGGDGAEFFLAVCAFGALFEDTSFYFWKVFEEIFEGCHCSRDWSAKGLASENVLSDVNCSIGNRSGQIFQMIFLERKKGNGYSSVEIWQT